MLVESKLKELGIVLPEPLKRLGLYVPAVKVDDWVYISGMVAKQNGEFKYKGKVGRDLTLEQGYESAKISGINALAALKSAIGDLDKVERSESCRLREQHSGLHPTSAGRQWGV